MSADGTEPLWTWADVAALLPADVVEAIVAGAEEPAGGRGLLAAARDWWNRPRGFAAVVAAGGASSAALVAALTGRSRYTVQRGDTLSGIARRYGTTAVELALVNRLDHPNRLDVGQVLIVG